MTMGNSENALRDYDSTWDDEVSYEDATKVILPGLVIFMHCVLLYRVNSGILGQ